MQTEEMAVAAVWDEEPVFVAGVAGLLRQSSIRVEAWQGDPSWVTKSGRRCVIVGVGTPSGLENVVWLRGLRTDLPIIAVVGEEGRRGLVRAIAAGATSAIPRSSSVSTIRDVVVATIDGLSCLPSEVMSSFASKDRSVSVTIGLTQLETDLLAGLAEGRTVSSLADRLHFSQRSTHRRLNGLYSRLGVANRASALIRATELRLIDEHQGEQE